MLWSVPSDVFRALADPTRREILRRLRRGPLTAGELADLFPQSRSTLSAHFSVLRTAGLVENERRGQTIVYRLNSSILEEAITGVLDALGALQQAATRMPGAMRRKKGARA